MAYLTTLLTFHNCKRMRAEAYRFSGKDAANYEQYLGPILFESSAVAFIPYLTALSASAILETSCGTGRLTRHLRNSFPSTTPLTATDLSSDMMQLAQEKLQGQPVHFLVADVQQLPFPDASFDLVVNQYGLMFIPDKAKAFAEAYRVLKPGGHFVFATWERTTDIPLVKMVIDDHVLPFFEGEDTTRFVQPYSMHDPRALLALLQEAGFTHNRIMLVEFPGSAASALDVVNGFFARHPLGGAVKEKDPAAFNRIAAQIEAALIARFGPGAFGFTLKAWLGIGQK
ncbi:MAG: methyltransferase domain-containing protein [Bacteroidota bacterium]|nr:methyltransferase domain-containing protein [Bacteroidota bacterium]